MAPPAEPGIRLADPGPLEHTLVERESRGASEPESRKIHGAWRHVDAAASCGSTKPLGPGGVDFESRDSRTRPVAG